MKHYKPEDDKYKSADTMQNLIKLMLNFYNLIYRIIYNLINLNFILFL